MFKPFWRSRVESKLNQLIELQELILMSFEDLKAAQDETDAKIAAVKADVEELLAKLANVPQPGLTPEQEAALADAVAHAKAINDSLAAVDAEAK